MRCLSVIVSATCMHTHTNEQTGKGREKLANIVKTKSSCHYKHTYIHTYARLYAHKSPFQTWSKQNDELTENSVPHVRLTGCHCWSSNYYSTLIPSANSSGIDTNTRAHTYNYNKLCMCSSTKVITNKYPPPLRALLVVERNIATQATACRHQRTQRRQHSQRQRRRHTPLDLSLIQQSFCFALPVSEMHSGTYIHT